ncbi:MAG: hypothetical protein JW861_04210, partial [Bacteroidales bacterium]|nr:hypothetical protein [Bacteroidales bacterium]
MKSSWIKLPLAALLMLVLMISCHRTSSPEQPPDAAFMDWITAYTGGMISSAASIEIHFARDADPSRAGNPAALFRFRPAISGEAFWKDRDVLVFRPEKPMESGKKYDVVFKLGQLFDVPPDLREFPFSFGVIRQSFVVGVDGVFSEYDDFSYMALKGVVKLADVAEPDRIEKVLTARLKGQSLWIRWEHDLAAKISVFRIDSLLRTGEDQEVVIIWKGKPLQTEDEGETSVLIPSKDSFRVMEAHVVQHPEQYISILFSDPLSGSQSLSGLVIVEGVEDLKFTARRNELQVHPPARLQGRQVLRIDGTVRSLFEKALKDPHEIVLSFDALYPAVKFVNTGNILPQSGNLVIPFQAVNLNAVDVRIIRIYAVNIPQFLQSNEIGGQYELNRVGRP